ncbi:FadR/GntR family transcriptional regulator [Streptomyces sp. NPDC059477]|uniref:FadR/GntR family transcriptional regulator n=1 Tax=Streptomyces sp. NPDC059477 TaxID=3346847 RepID=UPI0036790D1B
MTDDMNNEPKFRRFDRGRVADRIMEDLRNQILTGTLTDGSRLPAERELAEQYGVSGATVREAVRALTTMGLVSVRHGSGSFVTASADRMIAESIASAIQLKHVGAPEVLDLLGVLNARAVETGATDASDEEIAALRSAAEKLAVVTDVEETAADLRRFLHRLSDLSRNALLSTLCRFFSEVQVELAFALSGGPNLADWQRNTGALHAHRMAVVEAVEARDGARAAAMVRAYHTRALEVVTARPRADGATLSDPQFSQLIAALIDTRFTATAR